MTVMMESYTPNFMAIEFVEFLEMVCRVADVKFRDTDLGGKELVDKVSYVLSDLLWSLLGSDFAVNELNQNDVEISESDEDY